jgi:hypothetical protein
MAQIQFRSHKFHLLFCLKLAVITGVFSLLQTPQVLFAKGIPQRWQVNQYQPPVGIGKPIRVEGGGTRSASGSTCLSPGKPLMALLPSSNFGATVAAYPSFFVYMPALSPQRSSLPVEFVLQDKNNNEIYKASFKTSGKPGIVTLTLPTQAGLLPLEVGQDYKWSFSVICQSDDRSKDMVVDGLVRRVALNPTLSTQLKQASPQKQVELYAEAELWQDALAIVAQLRRDKPTDSAVAADWAKLLTAAGLENLTQELLLPTSATAERPITSSQP